MRKVLDNGGLLLARLPKGQIGDDTARLAGSLVIAKAWQAALARASVPEHARRDASLYVDECHNFLNLPGALESGNRQKIGIMLAVMARPEVLILDEPTPGLDPLMRDEFDRLVRELAAEGRTVFLSSHELDQVQRIADRVAIIKDSLLVVTDAVRWPARENDSARSSSGWPGPPIPAGTPASKRWG